MKNLPNKTALKRMRFLSRRCSDLGFAALASSKTRCDHLRAKVHLTSSDLKTIEYLRDHGAGLKRVVLELESFIDAVNGEKALNMLRARELLVERLTAMEELKIILEAEPIILGIKLLDISLFKKGDILQNLKSLSFSSNSEPSTGSYGLLQVNLINQILKVCPQLESITGVNEALLSDIRTSGKLSLVKKLRSFGENISTSTVMTQLVKAEPKLVELHMNIDSSELVALLKLSEDSLEKLELEDALQSSRSRQPIPANIRENPISLPKLKSISKGTLEYLAEILGDGRVAKALPKLEYVVFHRDILQKLPSSRGVEFEDVFGSVTSVELPDIYPMTSHPPLTNIFPNLHTVQVSVLSLGLELPQIVADGLWSLPPTIKFLQLEDFQLRMYSGHGVDAVLTGIPRKKLKVSAMKARNELQTLNPDDYRGFPSVLNLPNLKSLVFKCVDSHLTAVDFCKYDPTNVYISQLARWGALDRLADLQLIFSLPYNYIGLAGMTQVANLLDAVKDIAEVTFHHKPTPRSLDDDSDEEDY